MGEKTGPNPTDRAKRGTKRSLLTDARGTPLSVVVAGANRNDHIPIDDCAEITALSAVSIAFFSVTDMSRSAPTLPVAT